MTRIVVAIGGNALGYTPWEQIENLRKATPHLVGLIEAGNDVVFAHGNGPQVGIIGAAFDTAHDVNPASPAMELPESTAMSQGYIGYHLQQQLGTELARRGLDREVATIVTQVEVDQEDPAFASPTKPIGAPVGAATAEQIMRDNPGVIYKEDSGRGWRRTVASPTPQNVVESKLINSLIDLGIVAIACGGGGVPVVREGETGLVGVPAVIDKDLASAELAEEIGAEELIILTDVATVKLNYGTPQEVSLKEVTAKELQEYAEAGHFAPGSMLPKAKAAVQFVAGHPGRRARIASLENVGDPESGTHVIP